MGRQEGSVYVQVGVFISNEKYDIFAIFASHHEKLISKELPAISYYTYLDSEW